MLLVFNKINRDVFLMVKDGRKKTETRAATPKYKKIKEGDELIFSCDGERFTKRVSKIEHFSSIDTLLKVYAPEDIHPEKKTKEQIVAMYYSFPGYQEKIKEAGLLAFHLQ